MAIKHWRSHQARGFHGVAGVDRGGRIRQRHHHDRTHAGVDAAVPKVVGLKLSSRRIDCVRVHGRHRAAHGGGCRDWRARRFGKILRAIRACGNGALAFVDRHVAGAFGISLCHWISIGVATTAASGAGRGRVRLGRAAVERQLLRAHAGVADPRAIVRVGRGIVGHTLPHVVARRALHGTTQQRRLAKHILRCGARKHLHVRRVQLVASWSVDCPAAHANAGVAEPMNQRRNSIIFLMLLMCAMTNRAHSDGGQVIATATLGNQRAVMMVNPSQATVGIVAVIVRVSEGLEPMTCVLSALAFSSDAPIQCALSADPDGLGQRALIECAQASLWTISARLATARGEIELKGELQVAPAPPKWQSQLPWILAWIPIAGILCVRQLARRHAKHYDAPVELFLPPRNL